MDGRWNKIHVPYQTCGNRVDAILFCAGEIGQGVFIGLSVACPECYASFENAIQTKEKKKIAQYKTEVEVND